MTIKEAQKQVDNWIKEYGVRYFNEMTNTAMLMEEVGEVARIMARRYGEQSEKESDKNKDLGDEMADVMFVLICLANQTGINLEEAMIKNLEKKTNRDHSRHKENEKLKKMTLAKLRSELIEILPDKGISELNEFQERILDAMKSGKNILGAGPEGCGKTTSILLSVLQKIKDPGEGSPRAIVVCASDQKAVELHAELQKICRILDLTVDLAHGKGNMLQQRNDIFDGTEIIVGTARRLYELYIQNGYNVSQMKLFVLDDAETLFKENHKVQISRIVESLPKCQHMLFSTRFTDYRLVEYLDEFVPFTQLIEAKEEEKGISEV